MKNKRGKKRGEIETRKLIGTLLVAFVVIIAVIFLGASISNGGVIDNLLKKYPDFFQTNKSYIPPPECPSGYVDVGFITSKNYLATYKETTNLHIGGSDEKKIMIHFSSGKQELVVGEIESNQEKIIRMYSVYGSSFDVANNQIEYREYPSKETFEQFNGALLYKNTLCKTYADYRVLEDKKACVLTCELLNGECSSIPLEGKIYYSGVKCQNGENCYIDYTGDSFSSENLSIEDAQFRLYSVKKTKDGTYVPDPTLMSKFLKVNPPAIKIPTKLKLSLSLNSKIPFCYLIDNEVSRNYLGKDYRLNSDKLIPIESFQWHYSGENMLFFVAWSPVTKEKLLAKWRLEDGGFTIDSYNKDNIVKDKDFYTKLVETKVGSEFYTFDVKRNFIKPASGFGPFGSSAKKIIVTEFKIKKTTDSRYTILYLDESTQTYNELDCNIGSWSYNDYSGEIKDAKATLSETIDYKCKLK